MCNLITPYFKDVSRPVTNEEAETDFGLIILCVGWNAFMDFALAILPVSIVGNLKMDMKRKVGLCILLGLGILYVSDYSWMTFGA